VLCEASSVKEEFNCSIVSGEGEVYGVRRSDPDAWPWLQTLP
jgi:hypothetical protein